MAKNASPYTADERTWLYRYAERPVPYKGFEFLASGDRAHVYATFDFTAVTSTFGYDPNEIGFSEFYQGVDGHRIVVDVKNKGDDTPIWVAYRSIEKQPR